MIEFVFVIIILGI